MRRPTLGEDVIWLHPGEPVFDALAGENQDELVRRRCAAACSSNRTHKRRTCSIWRLRLGAPH